MIAVMLFWQYKTLWKIMTHSNDGMIMLGDEVVLIDSPLTLRSTPLADADEHDIIHIDKNCTISQYYDQQATSFFQGPTADPSYVFLQWIDDDDSEVMSTLVKQWKAVEHSTLIVVSNDCVVLQSASNIFGTPTIAAHSMRHAFEKLISYDIVSNKTSIQLIGWSEAALVLDGNVATTLRSLAKYDANINGVPWIATGRLNINEEDDISILRGNHSQAIPDSATIFEYPFNKYLPDWYLPYGFVSAVNFNQVTKVLPLESKFTMDYGAIQNNTFKIIDTTATIGAYVLHSKILQTASDENNIRGRAFLRQAVLETRPPNNNDHVTINKLTWPPRHVLEEIAPKRTVIVSSTNCGFLNFAQNWLLSIEKLEDSDEYSRSILLIAEDVRAFEDLEKIIPGRVVLPPFDVESESQAVGYWDGGFGKLVSSRPMFLINILEQGYTLLWCDIDMVLNRNPMPMLLNSPQDFVVSTDFKPEKTSLPKDYVCTCFTFMRPGNKRLLELMYAWRNITKEGKTEDQLPFNDLLQNVSDKVNMTILKPHHQYPPGWMYFQGKFQSFNASSMQSQLDTYVTSSMQSQCKFPLSFQDPQWYKKNNESEPLFVHNNWIIGAPKKIKRFRDIKRWAIDQHPHALPSC